MPRSGEDARRRLQEAALELYRERGYDQATTAEIAARAGVTERTYFRHFADKREVLFEGEATLRAALLRTIADAPDGLDPLALLLRAFRSVEDQVEANRGFAAPRQQVIAATPALRERELAKVAAMMDDLTSALRQRGVAERVAGLAAQTGMVAFNDAYSAWLGDPSGGLDVHVRTAFDDLRALWLSWVRDDRPPTSHERMTGLPWDASYQDGPAPWDVGYPQPAIARVVAAGGFSGAVLDAGCGTGENTLLVASLGLPVLGVDVAETAVEMARAKAADRGLAAEFATADAFHLDRLGRTFTTVMDCGLFHTCDADERPVYVASLASVTEPGGTLHLLCFSDQGPDVGPHPVSEADLRAAFAPESGWRVDTVEPDRVRTRFHGAGGAPAWLATITRV